MSEQQRRNGEWVPLLSDERPEAVSDRLSRKIVPPDMSPAEREAYERYRNVRAHAGNLRQGLLPVNDRSVVGFEGAKGCFDAVATYRIDQIGVTLLFPAGLDGALNRFFIPWRLRQADPGGRLIMSDFSLVPVDYQPMLTQQEKGVAISKEGSRIGL